MEVAAASLSTVMLSISAGFSRLKGDSPEFVPRLGVAWLKVPGNDPVVPREVDRKGTPSTRNSGLLVVLLRLFKPRMLMAWEVPGRPLVWEISSPGIRPSSTSMTLLTGSWAMSAEVTVLTDDTLIRRVLVP